MAGSARATTQLFVHPNLSFLARVATTEINCVDYSSPGGSLQGSLTWDCKVHIFPGTTLYRRRGCSLE